MNTNIGGKKLQIGIFRKVVQKSLRTIVGAQWWTRRHENEAFDTEIFPKCGLATSVRPENLDNWGITLIYYSKMIENVTKIEEFLIWPKMWFFREVRAENLGESVSRPEDFDGAVRSA